MTRNVDRSWFAGRVAALLASLVLLAGNSAWGAAGRVVVYASQDQVYAEAILQQFTQKTGIRVAPVFDSEAVKTVGLANRLVAERGHAQCDVFWSNEELRTRQLTAQGVFRPKQPWAAIGYRSRRIVVNTNRLELVRAPTHLSELTNAIWRGKIALAYPLFGTTATHFLALRQHWGNERWETWCRALAANKPFLVDGNSVAAQLVARGEAWVGLTDSDDIKAEQQEKAPILALPINEETLLIPNTIAVVKNAPDLDAAQRLWEFLQSPAVTQQLVLAGALEGRTPEEIRVRTLQPDWEQLLRDLVASTETLKRIFLR